MIAIIHFVSVLAVRAWLRFYRRVSETSVRVAQCFGCSHDGNRRKAERSETCYKIEVLVFCLYIYIYIFIYTHALRLLEVALSRENQGNAAVSV
jgi:hypothetical protein